MAIYLFSSSKNHSHPPPPPAPPSISTRNLSKCNKSLKDPVRGAGSAQVQIRSYRNRQSGNPARKVRNAFPVCKALRPYTPGKRFLLFLPDSHSAYYDSFVSASYLHLGRACPPHWVFQGFVALGQVSGGNGGRGGGGGVAVIFGTRKEVNCHLKPFFSNWANISALPL